MRPLENCKVVFRVYNRCGNYTIRGGERLASPGTVQPGLLWLDAIKSEATGQSEERKT